MPSSVISFIISSNILYLRITNQFLFDLKRLSIGAYFIRTDIKLRLGPNARQYQSSSSELALTFLFLRWTVTLSPSSSSWSIRCLKINCNWLLTWGGVHCRHLYPSLAVLAHKCRLGNDTVRTLGKLFVPAKTRTKFQRQLQWWRYVILRVRL